MSIAAACAARARVIEADKAKRAAEQKYQAAVEACLEGKESLSAEARTFFNLFVSDRTYSMKTVKERYIRDGSIEADIHSLMGEIMTMPIMDGVRAEIKEEHRDEYGMEAQKDGTALWYHVVLTWPGPAVKSAAKTG